MKTLQCILLVSALLLSAKCQDPQPAPPCKDTPDTCTPGPDGKPRFCLDLALTLTNGTTLERSTCFVGDCSATCGNANGMVCDSSACATNLCTCTINQDAATVLLTSVVKAPANVAGGIVAGALGLIVGIAANVPKLISTLTGGVSLDQVVAIINGIPVVGPIVIGLLKGLGILDIAGGVVSTVLNLSNGVLGAVTGILGGLGQTAGGVGGGLLGGALNLR